MNKPVAWISRLPEGDVYNCAWAEKQNDDDIPLYTHPVKELNDGGEPVKNATYWKRQHDNLLLKLNTCAIKVSELEKKLDIRTRELIGASFYEYDYKTMMANNKPVAWIKEDTLTYLGNYNYASITIQVQKSKSVGFDIPLYTHPVKELTDEEILKFIDAFCTDMGNHWELSENNALEMIKAILRKAQEK